VNTLPAQIGFRAGLRVWLTAAIAVAVGVASRALLLHVFNVNSPYLTFLPCVLVAVLLGGTFSGLLTLFAFVALSAVAPEPTTLVRTSGPLSGLFLFCALASCLLVAGHWANLTRRRALLASEVLGASEDRLRVALEAGKMGTWEWMIATGRVIWSPGLEAIHGRAPGTFKGTFDDVLSDIYAGDRERVAASLQNAVARKSEYHIEYRIVTGQGEDRWLESRGRVFCDKAGVPQRMTGICMDVSNHREAERRLAAATRHFKVLTETVPELVWSCSPDGRVEYVNPQYVAFTGINLAEVNKAWRSVVHPEDVSNVEEAWGVSLRDGRPFELEYRFRCAADGQYRWFLSRTVPVRDDAGELVLWVGTATDLHEAKVATQERDVLLAAERAAREEAERAGRVKDQFLAVLSHELRTPLTPVLLTISLLESHPELPDDVKIDINTIRRNVELEARLIDDLLDLTRIARGKISYDFQTVDVHLLIRSAMGVSCTDGMLSVECDLAAKNHHMRGDPARLQQVFWNLLNNAWKFTPRGGSLIIRSVDAGRDRLRVEVIDNGAGIDPQVLPRIFDAFEQGDTVRARKFGGLGLGLAISKALVQAHNGTISGASRGLGQGSTFTVELPTVAVARASERRPAPPDMTPVNGSGSLRVLLVEDHSMTLSALTKLLRQMGHQVVGAATFGEGLKAAGLGPYDLLISDLGLPDGTGHDLMREVRRLHGIKGIALSGYGMDEDIARSHEAGFEEHVVKPIDFQRLQAAITRVAAPGGQSDPVSSLPCL
jgi:PAS domain S-box-containing protein